MTRKISGAMSNASIPDVSNYEVIKLIGEGAFGQVYLVQHHVTNQLYAMKVVDKKNIMLKRQKLNVISERLIMEKIKSPFITKLVSAF